MRTKRQLARDDAKRLAEYYAAAHNKLVRILVEGQTDLTSRRRARAMLKEVNKVIDNLDAQTRKFIDARIPVHYKRHAKDALKIVSKTGVDARFTQIHENAIKAFAEETYNKFAVGLTATTRKATQVINQALRENITREIAKGAILGSTLDSITGDIVGEIKRQGITGLVDKRGRNLNIESYARTLAYTEIANAGRTAINNVALQYNLDLVIVSSHNSKHEECAMFEGKVLSLTGATPGYPTLEDAKASGIFHVNCMHTYSIIAPEDVTESMKL